MDSPYRVKSVVRNCSDCADLYFIKSNVRVSSINYGSVFCTVIQ